MATLILKIDVPTGWKSQENAQTIATHLVEGFPEASALTLKSAQWESKSFKHYLSDLSAPLNGNRALLVDHMVEEHGFSESEWEGTVDLNLILAHLREHETAFNNATDPHAAYRGAS